MQALILAGGEGTRLRPLTSTLPKPVVPLVGRPFIGYMVDWLARHGIDDIVISCGFMADEVRRVLGEGADGGPRLRYASEPEPRGTAGAVKFAEDMLGERFLVLNGDVLTDIDLTALVAAHERAGASATIALYPVEDPSAYGLVRHRPDGEITEFLEKPDPAEIDTDEINAGAYVLESPILDLIPPDRAVSIEREVFPRLIGSGLYGLRSEGYWMDIGTPDRYLAASWDILEGRVKTSVGEVVPLISPETEIEATACVEAPVLIEAGARIDAQARVGPRVVVGSNCRVGAGAVVQGSVLLPGCSVGDGASIRDSILSARCEIDPGVDIPAGSVLGEGERVERR